MISAMSATDYADVHGMVDLTQGKTYQRGKRGVKAIAIPSSEVKARLGRKVSSEADETPNQEPKGSPADVNFNPLLAAMQDPMFGIGFIPAAISSKDNFVKPSILDQHAKTTYQHARKLEGDDRVGQRRRLNHADYAKVNKIEYISNDPTAAQPVNISALKMANAGWNVTPIKLDIVAPKSPPITPQNLKSILLRHKSSKRDTLANLYDDFDVDLTLPLESSIKNSVRFAEQDSPTKNQHSETHGSSSSSTTLVEIKEERAPPIPTKDFMKGISSPTTVVDYNSAMTPFETSQVAYTYYPRPHANSADSSLLPSQALEARDRNSYNTEINLLQRSRQGVQSFTEGKQWSSDSELGAKERHSRAKSFKDLLWK